MKGMPVDSQDSLVPEALRAKLPTREDAAANFMESGWSEQPIPYDREGPTPKPQFVLEDDMDAYAKGLRP